MSTIGRHGAQTRGPGPAAGGRNRARPGGRPGAVRAAGPDGPSGNGPRHTETLNKTRQRKGSARPGGGGRLANRPVDGLRPERARAPGAIAPALGAGRALPGRLWASRATSGWLIAFKTKRQVVLRAFCSEIFARTAADTPTETNP